MKVIQVDHAECVGDVKQKKNKKKTSQKRKTTDTFFVHTPIHKQYSNGIIKNK